MKNTFPNPQVWDRFSSENVIYRQEKSGIHYNQLGFELLRSTGTYEIAGLIVTLTGSQDTLT